MWSASDGSRTCEDFVLFWEVGTDDFGRILDDFSVVWVVLGSKML